MPQNQKDDLVITKETQVQEIIKKTASCSCDACKNSCRFGSGFATAQDLQKIADYLHMGVDELKKNLMEEKTFFHTTLSRPKLKRKKEHHPFGACVFFDEEKGCTIHEVKPTECKVAMPCDPIGEDTRIWFLVNHFLNPADPISLQEYAVYLKTNGRTIPKAELHEVCKDEKIREEVLSYKRVR